MIMMMDSTTTIWLANVVASAVAVVLLYAFLSFLIIVTNNCDTATALTPRLRKDRTSPPFEDGAVVWITGAGSGLGECLAYLIAESSRDVKLILSSRKAQQLEKVATKCRELGEESDKGGVGNVQVQILPLDLSDLESIPSKVQQAQQMVWKNESDDSKSTSRKIDVLINGAGVTTRSYCSDSNFELDYYVTKVNYLGPLCLIKNLFPALPTTIIQLGSIASKLGAPVRSAYSGSKFALHGWLEALGVESVLQRRDVYGLNCILGSIDTGLATRALVDVTPEGKFVTLQEEDTNLSVNGLNKEWVCEKILAVAKQKKLPETWIANNKELIPILYFVTYARHTAFKVLTNLIGMKYAVTAKKTNKNNNAEGKQSPQKEKTI